MSKRGENIHKRKDGRWEARYRKGRNSAGNIIYGSVYGKTYREAKEKLMAISATPEDTIKPINQEHNFKEILCLWMENNRIRHKGATIKKYQYLIDRHILPDLGNLKLSQITSTVINSFLTRKMENGKLDKSGGLSASYVRSIMLIINAALKFAADEEMCQPLKSPVYKPVSQNNEITVLQIDEQKRLETHLISEIAPTQLGILISLHTGLRIGEICALAWEDVDIENRIIHVRHTVARIKSTDFSEGNSSKLIIDAPKTKASNRDIRSEERRVGKECGS